MNFDVGDKVRCTNTQLHEIFGQVGVVDAFARTPPMYYVRFPDQPLWCLFEEELEHV